MINGALHLTILLSDLAQIIMRFVGMRLARQQLIKVLRCLHYVTGFVLKQSQRQQDGGVFREVFVQLGKFKKRAVNILLIQPDTGMQNLQTFVIRVIFQQRIQPVDGFVVVLH